VGLAKSKPDIALAFDETGSSTFVGLVQKFDLYEKVGRPDDAALRKALRYWQSWQDPKTGRFTTRAIPNDLEREIHRQPDPLAGWRAALSLDDHQRNESDRHRSVPGRTLSDPTGRAADGRSARTPASWPSKSCRPSTPGRRSSSPISKPVWLGSFRIRTPPPACGVTERNGHAPHRRNAQGDRPALLPPGHDRAPHARTGDTLIEKQKNGNGSRTAPIPACRETSPRCSRIAWRLPITAVTSCSMRWSRWPSTTATGSPGRKAAPAPWRRNSVGIQGTTLYALGLLGAYLNWEGCRLTIRWPTRPAGRAGDTDWSCKTAARRLSTRTLPRHRELIEELDHENKKARNQERTSAHDWRLMGG